MIDVSPHVDPPTHTHTHNVLKRAVPMWTGRILTIDPYSIVDKPETIDLTPVNTAGV